jgi:hypothetical protein
MDRTGAQQRARRFEITAQIIFRQANGDPWRSAWTLNLSRTGVLFRARGAKLDRRRGVEFVVALPPLGVRPAGQIHCNGRVVRMAPNLPADDGREVAVTIESYEFERRESHRSLLV